MNPTLLKISILTVALVASACDGKPTKKKSPDIKMDHTSVKMSDGDKGKKKATPIGKALKKDEPLLASMATLLLAAMDKDKKADEDKLADTATTAADSETAILPEYEPTLDGYDGVTLRRLITAPEIENREPVASGSLFGYHGEPVYAFMDIQNENDYERELTVNFIGPNGEVRGGVKVSVPANVPRWRTWAFTKHANAPGTWRVEVRSEDATLLGSLFFDVEEGC